MSRMFSPLFVIEIISKIPLKIEVTGDIIKRVMIGTCQAARVSDLG